MMLERVRDDRSLPDGAKFRDDGCQHAASCLPCPLLRCKHDDPGQFDRTRRRVRNAAIRRARDAGVLSVVEIGRRFGVAPRTVQRALAATKDRRT